MIKQKRILIVRPDRIGDVVLSTPIPKILKDNFPNSHVAVLLREYTREIYAGNPFVDDVLITDSEKFSWQKVEELRRQKFTHALMLLPNEKINYMLFFAGVRVRIGVGHKFFQFLTNAKSVYRRKYKPLRHEADFCMDTVRKLGVQVNGDIEPVIYLTKDEQSYAEKKRHNFLSGKKYLIGIHTTSGKSAPNWKPEVYAKLIGKLADNPDYQVAVTDNVIPEEVKDIRGVIYPNVNSDLRSTIINLSTMDALVSASTGPMHLASALKVKTVSLFCPLTACSPQLWGPLGNKSNVITPPDNFCGTRCPGDPHLCSYEGEEGINADTVYEKIEDILK